MNDLYSQADDLIKNLNDLDKIVIFNKGYAIGRTQYHSSIMRPLVNKGIFDRVDRKGFRTYWGLTYLGMIIHQELEKD